VDIPEEQMSEAIGIAQEAAEYVFNKTVGNSNTKRSEYYRYSAGDLKNHIFERFLAQPVMLRRYAEGQIGDLKLKDYFIRYGHELVTTLREQSFAMPVDGQRETIYHGGRDWSLSGPGDNFLSADHVRAFLSFGIFDSVVYEALAEVDWTTAATTEHPFMVQPEDFTTSRIAEFQLVYDGLRRSHQEVIYRAYGLGERLSHAEEEKLSVAVEKMTKALNMRLWSSYEYMHRRREHRRSGGVVRLNLPEMSNRHRDDSTWTRPQRGDIERIRETRRGNERNRRVKVRICADCGSEFEHDGGRGRPPKRCPDCRG
jgi:hypothetical protein